MSSDTIIAIGALATTWVLTIIGGVIWAARESTRSADRSANNSSDIEEMRRRKEEMRQEYREIGRKLDVEMAAVRAENAEFREHVARNYASVEIMNRMEERIVDALNRLGDRFDAYMNKKSSP